VIATPASATAPPTAVMAEGTSPSAATSAPVGAAARSAGRPPASGSAIAAPRPIAHAVTASVPWRASSAFWETKNVAGHDRRDRSGARVHAPPAISQHLAALERQVGVALLERQGRRVTLTPAARLLVGRTERVLAELEAAEAELAADGGEVRGTVRLAAFPTAAATIVPRAMASFASDHPAAEVTLAELEPEDALPALKLGEVDVAVIQSYDFSPRPPDPSVELTLLLEDDLHVAVPADHPAVGDAVELEALAGERWIAGYLDTACHRVVVTSCRAAGFEPRVVARSTTSAPCWPWSPPARASRSSRAWASTASPAASAWRGRRDARCAGASSRRCAAGAPGIRAWRRLCKRWSGRSQGGRRRLTLSASRVRRAASRAAPGTPADDPCHTQPTTA
jgi:DNA-binding transcriptional LysR family regulator